MAYNQGHNQYRVHVENPINKQALKQNNPNLDFNEMERQLAFQLAQMEIQNIRKQAEFRKMAENSDEIKELKGKINAAQLNKERSA